MAQLWALLEELVLGFLEAAGLAGWQGSAGRGANVVSGPAVGPTRRTGALIPRILQSWHDWQGSADQEVSGVKGVSVGPTRKLAILESCSPGMPGRDLLARKLACLLMDGLMD